MMSVSTLQANPCFTTVPYCLHPPNLERIRIPTTEKQRLAKTATHIMKAKAWFGSFQTSCSFFKPLSIAGASAAAPATRKGLVTLLPPHMRTTTYKASIAAVRKSHVPRTTRIQRSNLSNLKRAVTEYQENRHACAIPYSQKSLQIRGRVLSSALLVAKERQNKKCSVSDAIK